MKNKRKSEQGRVQCCCLPTQSRSYGLQTFRRVTVRITADLGSRDNKPYFAGAKTSLE